MKTFLAVAILTLCVYGTRADDCADNYIVVGAGPAGCVFARRAAEQGKTVLLLERGDFSTRRPFNVGNRNNLWNTDDIRIPRMFAGAVEGFSGAETLVSQPNPFLGDLPTLTFQGNMKGGGSGMNAMLWARPDLNSEFGSGYWPSGWDEGTLSQAFRAVEHGPRTQDGLVNLEQNSFPTSFSSLLLGYAPFAGLTPTTDFNAVPDSMDVIQMSEITRLEGKRHDAFTAYIDSLPSDVRNQYITVMTGVTVDWIQFEDDSAKPFKAKGVWTDDGNYYCASEGVIVAAGALKSPAILEQSGVGPGGSIVSNEDVGEHLQDHLSLLLTFGMGAPPDYVFNDFREMQVQAQAYRKRQEGLFADSFAKLLIFSKELPGSEVQNFEAELFEGFPFFANPDANPNLGEPVFSVIGFAAQTLDINSRGSVHNGAFTANWGGDPTELQIMAAGIQRIRILLDEITRDTGLPFFEFGPDGSLAPVDPNYRDDEQTMRARLGTPAPTQPFPAYSAFHFCGSLALDKVVDPNTMQVMGVKSGSIESSNVDGLYVVDASLFPRVPRKNTMALTYAVAEVAASKILDYDLDTLFSG